MRGLMIAGFIIQATIWWVIASAVTSGVKAVSDDCGTEYKIESVVAGDWFCPT